MQLKYLDLDGLTSFYNQFTDKVTELVTAEVEEAGSALESSLQGWVNAKLGAASGIATLDANQKLTASQLPDITFPDYTNIYVALGATNQTVQGNKTFSGTTTFGSSLTISNAGISKIQPITDISINDWNEIINTNLNSVFYVTKEIIENMIHNKNGLIINISSIWGIVGASCETHYSATKAGINGFTKALAKELGPSNIRVNAIAPGIIETEMNNLDDIQDLENEIPLR